MSRFRNLADAMQRINIDKIESQVAPAEEAGTAVEMITDSLKNIKKPQAVNSWDRALTLNAHAVIIEEI